MHDPAAERAFLEEIDCRFPHGDETQAAALIRRGAALSPNAACATLAEIARPPASVAVSREKRRHLLGLWRATTQDADADALAEVAAAMIDGRRLSDAEAEARLAAIARRPGLYAALELIYAASEDAGDRLDAKVEAIRRAWEKDRLKNS